MSRANTASIVILIFMWTAIGLAYPAFAQSEGDEWSDPINLSRSGGATNPIIVLDAVGRLHAIWQDAFTSNVYTRLEGDELIPPAPVSLPFEETTPNLIAAPNEQIHAFWVDEQGGLSTSRVSAEEFENRADWSPTTQIASSVPGFDATVDSSGRLHLVYVTTGARGQDQAGVYYTSSGDGGQTWSIPALIYESQYFRTLTPEAAHVSITTAPNSESTSIFVTWDNRPRSRVFFSKSADNGQTWETPLEVDSPSTVTGASIPYNLKVISERDNVLLLWQVGEPEISCAQYWQSSKDQGATWSGHQRLFEEVSGCPDANRLLLTENGSVILYSTIQSQNYLLAWDGTRWSTPQIQRELSSFTDPETINSVDLGCHLPTLGRENRLYVIGCDEGSGGDIWLLSRTLGYLQTWFPQPSAWGEPETVVSNLTGQTKIKAVADPTGAVHIFFSQGGNSGSQPGVQQIDYVRQEGGQRSEPVTLVQAVDATIQDFSVAIDNLNRLWLAWSDGEGRQIRLSSADARLASRREVWTVIQPVTPGDMISNSPQILQSPDQSILIVFTVPINENRGVYLIQSADRGASWSEPSKVFDGVSAGWELVGQPEASRSSDGKIHLLLTRRQFINSGQPVALYYTRSDDGGITWADPEVIAEGPVGWSQIFASGERIVHRFWQIGEAGNGEVWHQLSTDSGLTWNPPASISDPGVTPGPASLVVDSGGRPHFLQLVLDRTSDLEIRHSVWERDGWVVQETLIAGVDASLADATLAATVSPLGQLTIASIHQNPSQSGNEALLELTIASRRVELPAEAATPLPPLTPTPQVEPSPTPTPSPSPSPTPDLKMIESKPGGPLASLYDPGNAWLSSAIGVILASIIVGFVLIIIVRSNLMRRHY